MNQPSARRSRGRDEYQRYIKGVKLVQKIVAKLPQKLRYRLLGFPPNSDNKLARLIRFSALSSLADSCGELVDIRNQVDLFGVENLKVGSRVSIHPKCYIDATGGITVGNDVSIAHHTSILSTTHVWKSNDEFIRDQPVVNKPTQIHDNVWIGAGCRIMAGVEVHSRSIIAAGAVVTSDVPQNSIVAGVPARVIKNIRTKIIKTDLNGSRNSISKLH